MGSDHSVLVSECTSHCCANGDERSPTDQFLLRAAMDARDREAGQGKLRIPGVDRIPSRDDLTQGTTPASSTHRESRENLLGSLFDGSHAMSAVFDEREKCSPQHTLQSGISLPNYGATMGSTLMASSPAGTIRKVVSISEGEYLVEVLRRPGQPLGIEVCLESNFLIVTRIGKGLVSEWNKANPSKSVSVFDAIVEVDGERGKVDLITAVRKSGTLRLVFLKSGHLKRRMIDRL